MARAGKARAASMITLSKDETRELLEFITAAAAADCPRCAYTPETARFCPVAYWGERLAAELGAGGVCRLLEGEVAA